MYDANGAHSEEIQVSLSQQKDTYLLRYTPSTEWLHANERAYPVVLDPVVEAEMSLLAAAEEEKRNAG